MKTTKDFPATHSMSTSWFVADEDGNVALFDFDEEGPVPVASYSESTIESMFGENYFGEKDSDSIEYLELTDEQVDELMSEAVSSDQYNFENSYAVFVQVEAANKKEFLDVFKEDVEFCLSHKHGIYFVGCICDKYESDTYQNRQKETFLRTVKRAVHMIPDGYEEDFYGPEALKNWKLPFYCYKQPYASNAYLPERVFVPKFPFKEGQISEEQRHKLIHVPVKFSECTGFQIAQYAVCRWYSRFDYIERDGRIYVEFPKTGGGFCYILQDQDIETDGEIPVIIDDEEKDA